MDRSRGIGRHWQELLQKRKEYKIVESEYIYDVDTSFIDTRVGVDAFRNAEKIKKELIQSYDGYTIEEAIPGKVIENEAGCCYYISHQKDFSIEPIAPVVIREMIISELKLIRGIGPVTAEKLRQEGYSSIETLCDHPRFGSEARRCLEIIDRGDLTDLLNLLTQWLPKSHPLILLTSGLHRVEDYLVVDIESMGIFTRPIILIGVAQIRGRKIYLHQYLIRNIEEEAAGLVGFLSHINEQTVFITFNGLAFDIPSIKQRMAYYCIDGDLERPHFDALYFTRRIFGKFVPNCQLTTLERCLFGTVRKNDIPSALVPEFYETYLLHKNCGPLVPIVEHNLQDLISLASIFARLHTVCRST